MNQIDQSPISIAGVQRRALFTSALLVLLVMISGCQLSMITAEPNATPDATADTAVDQSDGMAITYGFYQDEWLLSQADDAITWGSFRTDPGAVLYYDGEYHLFRNVFGGFPGPVEIGYATSPDGITWTDATDGPILSSVDVPFAGIAAVVTSALVDADGTWVLYFHTWPIPNPSLGAGEIGRATAPSPLGPWTVDAEPVLTRGAPEAWDGGQVSQPSVVRTGDGYAMSYTGADRRGFMQIGMATSHDGITWTKHNDPTTDGIFAESDPVLAPGLDDWDDGSAYQARITLADDGWIMIYKSLGNGTPGLGLARSSDGIAWQKAVDNPVLSATLMPDAIGFGLHSLLQQGEESWIYTEFFGWQTGSGIYLLTANGNLAQAVLQPQTVEEQSYSRQLRYVAYWGGLPARAWDKANWRAYGAQNPDLKIAWAGANVYGSPVNSNIVDDVVSESPPDVISGNIVGVLREYVDQGLIADISDLWQEEGWDEVFPASLKELVTVDGKQYFVPQAIQFNGIFYRKDHFAAAGLTPPETWDELLQSCDLLHAQGITPITITAAQWPPPIGFWFTHINLRLNGPEFHEQLMRGQVRYTDPRVHALFDHWLQLFDHNCFAADSATNTYQVAMNQLAAGEAAMYAHGTWLYQFYPADQADELGFFRFPIIDPTQPLGELIPMYGAFMPTKAANPAEARAFLAYLGTVESQQSNFDALGRLASNRLIDQSQYSEVLQQGRLLVEEADAITALFGVNTHPSLALAAYYNGFIPFWQEPTPAKVDEILTYIEGVRAQIYGSLE